MTECRFCNSTKTNTSRMRQLKLCKSSSNFPRKMVWIVQTSVITINESFFWRQPHVYGALHHRLELIVVLKWYARQDLRLASLACISAALPIGLRPACPLGALLTHFRSHLRSYTKTSPPAVSKPSHAALRRKGAAMQLRRENSRFFRNG